MKTAVAVSVLASLMMSAGVCRAAEPAQAKPTTASTTAPASNPAAKAVATRPARGRSPEARAAEDAIRAAVVELTREAQEAYRKEGGTLPRTESDYFKDKSPAIDQGALITALGRQISRDPRIDGYVKLQLLSAVEQFDTGNAKSAIDAYIKAPALVPLPGLTARELQPWDRKAMTAKEADIDAINVEFRQLLSGAEAANAPILAYRNEMMSKVQTDDETKPRLLQARVEELSQRAAAGFDTWKLWQSLSTDIQTWASLASKQQVSGMIAFLKDYAKRTGPTVYEELKWSKRGTPHADWKSRKAILEPKRMASLLDALKAAEANAL